MEENMNKEAEVQAESGTQPEGTAPETVNEEKRGTGLEFEVGEPTDEQLVFDETADILIEPQNSSMEIDLSDMEVPVEKLEIALPDVGGGEPREKTEDPEAHAEEPTFISDPLRYAPTYIPRFTEASEKFREHSNLRAQGLMPDPKEAETEPVLDATSEMDEQSAVTHVVVTQRQEPIKEARDDSMMILKFDSSEEEKPDVDAEEAQVEELTNVVLESSRTEEPEQPEAEPVVEETIPEEPVAEPEEKKEPTLPDPVLDVALVDFGTAEKDSESLSVDDAPSEGAKGGKHGEYTKLAEQDGVKDSFLDHLMSIKIRFAGAAVLMLLMIVSDILSLFSINVLDLFGLGGVSFARAVVDLQFSVCLAALALPEIIRAVKNLFKKVFSPEIVILVSLLLIGLHTIAVTVSSTPVYMTYGILLGIQVIFAILASHHRITADFTAFKIISRNQVKSVLDKRLTRTLPRENLALDGAVDEYKSKIARMFRTVFVSDFFSRSSVAVENSFNIILMTLVSLGVSLITSLISLIVTSGSFADFTSVLALVFLVSFPACSLLVHKLPHHCSANKSKADNSAFVGEESLYSCADIDVIAYDDVEVFGSEDVSIKKVHLYGKTFNLSKAMEQMYALFSAVGGPLYEVFYFSVNGKGQSATGIVIEDDGIKGNLNGHAIAAGTLEFMQREGFEIPEEDYKTNVSASDSTKVMYGAEDGKVYVKFFIRYSFSEEFTMLLPWLKSEHIVPLIYTRDPNLTVGFFKMLTMGDDIIRVMKKHELPSQEDKVYRRVSAGIVTLGGKCDAINMVLLSKKYVAYQSELSLSELIAMGVGAVAAIILTIVGVSGLPVIALGTLQLAWCIYLYIRSYHAFRDKKEKGKH